jgi:hypothetical protein
MKHAIDSDMIRHCGLDSSMLRASSFTFTSGGTRTRTCG